MGRDSKNPVAAGSTRFSLARELVEPVRVEERSKLDSPSPLDVAETFCLYPKFLEMDRVRYSLRSHLGIENSVKDYQFQFFLVFCEYRT